MTSPERFVRVCMIITLTVLALVPWLNRSVSGHRLQTPDSPLQVTVQLLRVSGTGQQSCCETVYSAEGVRPIVFGPADEQDYLVIYLSGIPALRGKDDLDRRVLLFAGGTEITPLYVSEFQINALLPRSLEGRGRVRLLVYVVGTDGPAIEIADLQFGVPPVPHPPQIFGFEMPTALAGSTLTIRNYSPEFKSHAILIAS